MNLTTLALDDLKQVYDGTPKSVTVIAEPADMDVTVTYDGGTVLPVMAGAYTVQATIDDAGYTGTVSDTLVIEPASQAINFAPISDTPVDAAPLALYAVAGSGLPVSFSLISGPATLSGNAVTLNGTLGEIVIEASQPGNANWNPATPVQQNFMVTEGSPASINAVSATTVFGQAGEPVAGNDLPTVRVADSMDNAVSGVTVSFSISSGNGSLSGSTQVTDNSGLAQLGGWVLGNTPTQTVEASAPGLNGNPVLFTANAEADHEFAITIDDNRSSIEAGERNTYIIVVSNVGSSDADGAEVTVELPPELDPHSSAWHCMPSPGNTCGGPGSGSLVDTVDLAAGASITYMLEADINHGPGRLIELVATIELGTSSASDSDTTTLVISEDAIFDDRFAHISEDGIRLATALDDKRLLRIVSPSGLLMGRSH